MPKSRGGMAYTRHKYVRSIPPSKIKIFTLGDKKREYSNIVLLKASHSAMIGSSALEAARVTANKILENTGEPYMLKILVYPHRIVREHKFMGFAGADRLSQGMSRSFGRSKRRSAKVNADQAIMVVYTESDGVDVAKKALKRASKKLPLSFNLVVKETGEVIT